MIHLLLRMRADLYLHLDPRLKISNEDSGWLFQRVRGPTPHMLIGLPSASRGVRFLLNFFPPVKNE